MDNSETVKTAKDKEGKIEVRHIPLKFTRSKDFKLYFANNVQISAGQTNEVQIFFAQLLADPIGHENDNATIAEAEQSLGIVMTMEHFRQIVEVFTKHLKLLEMISARKLFDKPE